MVQKLVKMKLSLNARNVEKILKEKKLLFAMWGCESNEHQPHCNYEPLKKILGDVIVFDPRKKKYEYGPEKSKEMLLKIITEQKPDYILLTLSSLADFDIDTLMNIYKISPKTKTIVFLTDDDTRFDNWTRYHMLFIDYGLVVQTHYLPKFKEDGLGGVFPAIEVIGIDTNYYKPLNLKKEYDVTFIGGPNKSRVELMRLLVKNKINLKIWGHGWTEYGDLRKNYMGPASAENYVKIINKSKISLGFSRNGEGELHIKGRIFEVAACKSFNLVDYFLEYLKIFKEGKEMVMFKDSGDLLEKIAYYLKHEKEREMVAENAYKKVIRKCNLINGYKNIFRKILNEESKFSRTLPKINGKIAELSNDDFKLGITSIKEKVNKADYICFRAKDSRFHKYKNYLQAYSLEKTKKEISCCSYSVYSKGLGDLLLLDLEEQLRSFNIGKFEEALKIDQLLVSRGYFLKNIFNFKEFFNGKRIDIINKENTSFIFIPLVRIRKVNAIKYGDMKKAFQMNFAIKLYSLAYQKKLLIDGYLYRLFIRSFMDIGLFPIKHVINYKLKKDKINDLFDVLK
ncbi:glycosyltransferase [Candidatus Pacearchaeota archaeon]|nr:glycosyltransferase [Candidatus Pacearchaeota archaeon]